MELKWRISEPPGVASVIRRRGVRVTLVPKKRALSNFDFAHNHGPPPIISRLKRPKFKEYAIIWMRKVFFIIILMFSNFMAFQNPSVGLFYGNLVTKTLANSTTNPTAIAKQEDERKFFRKPISIASSVLSQKTAVIPVKYHGPVFQPRPDWISIIPNKPFVVR